MIPWSLGKPWFPLLFTRKRPGCRRNQRRLQGLGIVTFLWACYLFGQAGKPTPGGVWPKGVGFFQGDAQVLDPFDTPGIDLARS